MITSLSKPFRLFFAHCIFPLLFFALTTNTWVWAQSIIKGRVVNSSDKKPVPNVNVFLSNATIGDKTATDGTYTLTGIKSGSYDLVVSMVGFETYRQPVKLNNENITLPDIEISAKSIGLHEVVIKAHNDPQRDLYYEIFKNDFLGSSKLAAHCRILNPSVLDFDYNDVSGELKASSYDFLEIENRALGYKVKYLLAEFSRDKSGDKVHFNGSVLFENMKGSPSELRAWLKKRQEVYEGSEMHFLRSLLNDKLDDGFRVLQYAIYKNPQRPPDSLIEVKIQFYTKLRSDKNAKEKWQDSLAMWKKMSGMPRIFKTLMHFSLDRAEILKKTDLEGIYALGCDFDALYIDYDKNHHFGKPYTGAATSPYNSDTTIVGFTSLFAFFDANGWVINPNSMSFSGAWGRYRVAGMLPADYEPQSDSNN